MLCIIEVIVLTC